MRIFLSILLLVAVERFCYFQTAGFRLDKLHSDYVHMGSCTCALDPNLLEQRFTFLGSGVQCYAFLGEDGTTVLKVFKHYHNMPIKGFIKSTPLPRALDAWRKSLIERREKRLHSIFSSCAIAYEEFRAETGMIGIHLQQTCHLQKKNHSDR